MDFVHKNIKKKNLAIIYYISNYIFSIKIHDLSDLKEMFAIISLEDERGLDKIEWTDDGQLLAVTTVKGNLHVYLTSLPMLAATQNTRIAHLTSLLEVTIEDNIQQVSSARLIFNHLWANSRDNFRRQFA